jgi:hypothetical protein
MATVALSWPGAFGGGCAAEDPNLQDLAECAFRELDSRYRVTTDPGVARWSQVIATEFARKSVISRDPSA